MRPSDPDRRLADRLRVIARQMLERADHLDDVDKPRPPELPAARSDSIVLLEAGVAMYDHGDKAEANSEAWSTTGLVLPATDPGSRSADCGCDPDDPNVNCPHGTATERAGLRDGPDHWRTRLLSLQYARSLLTSNARDYLFDVAHSVWTVDPKGRESSVRECANPNCERTITGIGNDRPRRGRCPRCATHLSRYDIDWPRRADPGDPDPDARPDANKQAS